MARILGLVLTAAIAAVSWTGVAHAQNYPTKPVTLIVPWPAGGNTDMVMRALAEGAQKHLGQTIVIENRVGASGTLGPATMAANAKPDGYTIGQLPITAFRLPFMTKTTYDPAKDFTYILGLTGYVFGVVVKSDAPWKTFEEFMADAKANPGKIKYATPGFGTSLHVTMEEIAKARGLKWVHVPYKGGAEANPALLGGHVHAVANATDWAPLVSSGDFRLLVTWTDKRTKNWPQVPTLKELGFEIPANSPFGLAGPKGMDPKVVKALHDAFEKGLQEPVVVAAFAKYDQEPAYLNTADYEKHVAEQIALAKRQVEELGLKAK